MTMNRRQFFMIVSSLLTISVVSKTTTNKPWIQWKNEDFIQGRHYPEHLRRDVAIKIYGDRHYFLI